MPLCKPSTQFELPRRVLYKYESFDYIRKGHLQLEHEGYAKTFKVFQQCYYGSTKEQVPWLQG